MRDDVRFPSEESASAHTDDSLTDDSCAGASACGTEEYCTHSTASPSLSSMESERLSCLPVYTPQQEYIAHEYCHLLHVSSLELQQIASYYRDANKPISSKLG